MRTTSQPRSRSLRRLAGIAIAGAAGALLIQSILRAGEGAAARSDGVRAVEDTRRSDSAAASSLDAALQFRMDEMRQRRTGHEEQRREKLRRLTPDERQRRIHPPPIRRPRRYRDFGDVLERVNHVRRQLDIPPFKAEP
jgi:hypothetical protein